MRSSVRGAHERQVLHDTGGGGAEELRVLLREESSHASLGLRLPLQPDVLTPRGPHATWATTHRDGFGGPRKRSCCMFWALGYVRWHIRHRAHGMVDSAVSESAHDREERVGSGAAVSG